MNLYELSTEFAEIKSILDECDGDVTEVDAKWLARIEQNSLSLQQKFEGCCMVVREWKAEAKALEEEEKRISDRRKAVQNRVDRFYAYMQACMEAGGINKIKTPLFSVALQNNPPAVLVENEDQIPPEYMEQTVKICTSKIKQDLKAGVDVPGAKLVNGQHVRIR
jgi:hypothetical protein